MSVLSLNNLTLSVGSSLLLDSVNAHVTKGHRIGVVGTNGCGKSTLLRALAFPHQSNYYAVGAGKIKYNARLDSGVVFVEQENLQWSRLLMGEEDELRSLTVFDALDLHAALSDDAVEDVDAFRRLTISADDALKWHTARYDITPICNLSPGCAIRAYLALALQRHGIELLLLDECSNHLDLPSLLWLQAAIITSGKTVVMVSHDGAFLDAVCDHIWAIDSNSKSMEVCGCTYSDFKRTKRLAHEHQNAAFEKQQKRHKQLTTAANKLRAASAAGARHMAKDNDKLQRDFRRDRAGRSGRKAKAIDALRDAQPKVERAREDVGIKFSITPLGASTQSSIMLSSVKLGYSTEALPLPPVSMRLDFGERVAIVGYNGVGKSTLLRTITGAICPVSGDVRIGRELRIGNLMQEHESLPRDRTPREYFSQLTGLTLMQTASRLIRYGLTLQQVDCLISELNPGARARALLAEFSIRNVNALILDEPTNHVSEEALKEVVATLNVFEGTVIVVSHNREFLSALQLTRILQLSTDGITEIESIDLFVEEIEDSVKSIVNTWLS